MAEINLWAMLVAALSAFMLGGLWYAPPVFGKVWQRESGAPEQPGHPLKVFGGAFAMFLGPAPGLPLALGAGFSAGLCWVASSFGINYLFAQRSLKLFLIDGGYHTIQFTLYGLILGIWP